jgi:hypothetical protein
MTGKRRMLNARAILVLTAAEQPQGGSARDDIPHQPAWYDDPDNSNAQRYWDGQNWTPHRQRKPIPGPAQPPVNYPQHQQQPAVALGAQQQSLPNSHLVVAVFSMFICFSFGILAIINATKVSNLWPLAGAPRPRVPRTSARKWAMGGPLSRGSRGAGCAFLFGVRRF